MSNGSATSTLEHRPLLIRARRDLQYHCQTYHGERWWLVKDPVALKYFRFREEACTALRMLDGAVSLHEIKQNLDRRFPKINTTYRELQSLIWTLHQSGLVLADAPGQGHQLFKRRGEQRRKRVLGQLSSILFLRLPGVDPERFLTWLYPKFRWFYSRWCVGLCIMLVVSALSLVTVHFNDFYQKLPDFYQFFNANNVLGLMVALALAKVLHEIGHGLTCKHFGGECHEIGVMLLVFTPCLYCDTSDSWILPNKWHRAAIGAAGMYVEIVLAAICTFLWWNTEPGFVHYTSLNIMFICSLSTLFFNSNPLLRYDGYYILADILEVPNLRQKSRNALVGLLRQVCLGLPWKRDANLPSHRRRMFAVYAVASFFYRWFILIIILWFLSEVFRPYGLQALAHVLIAVSLIGMVVMPAWQAIRFFRVPGRIQQVNKRRLSLTVTAIALLLLLATTVPLPHHVMTSVVIQPREPERNYVSVAGILESVSVAEGSPVEPGQELARLRNPEIAFQITRLVGERERTENHLQNLRRQRSDQDAAQEIPHTIEALASLDQQLMHLREDERRLTLVSGAAGMVMPPPQMPAETPDQGAFAQWPGTVLDKRHLHRWLEPGTLFCLIGDPQNMEATLVIDQGQIEFVQVGQEVEIKLDEYPSETWSGRIDEVARIDVKVAPRELSNEAGGDLTTEADPAGTQRPTSASYQARVVLANDQQRLMSGFRGRAKIHVGSRTTWQRLSRFLAELIRIR